MQDSSRPHRTFTAGFKQAQLFLRSLTVMKEMVPSARLIVKNGEIQVLVISEDRNANASLVMEASTAASWTSGTFAVQFCLSDWIELLVSRVNNKQENQLLWIYKIGKCPDLFCLLGNDRSPIRLGEAVFVKEEGMDLENLRSNRVTVELTSECLREIISIRLGDAQFVQEKGVDMKYLGRLASHPVKIHMRTQCLREVILAFAPKYVHVGLMVMNDRVTWHTIAGEFTYHAKNGDCLIEGVEKGTAHYLLVRWRRSKVLHFASTQCEEVSMCSLIHPDWLGWIRFSFFFDGVIPFLYLMRGSSDQI